MDLPLKGQRLTFGNLCSRNIKRADFLEFMALASNLNRTLIEPDIEFANRVMWYQIDTNADDCLSDGEFNAAFCADRACAEMDKVRTSNVHLSILRSIYLRDTQEILGLEQDFAIQHNMIYHDKT